MQLLSNANAIEYSKKGAALTEPDASFRRLNNALDKVAVPYVVNESRIEEWLDELEMQNDEKNPAYWLLLVRLNELALLCAGNYADNCEFSAAGDLLLNPRKIKVHFNDTKPSVIKKRHCSLSKQFGKEGQPREYVLQRLADKATIETKRPPLLPQLFRKMQYSGRVSLSYLDLANTRMKRIAETIGFLSSWQIFDATDLYRRISGATPEARGFVESNLCRFKNDLFFDVGNDVRRVASDPKYRSDFLAYFSFEFPNAMCC
ncbi:MAG: hypothetical protein SWH54_07185 [Thermodesulfobacteriota bacterium]|nr:hypothetical protein [Thermodesulfobacteriota bacterium]